MNDFRADYFTDDAIVERRIQDGANDLGEPIYPPNKRFEQHIAGLYVVRARQVWRDLGLTGEIDAVFMTTQLTEWPADAVLVVGGRTYRKVTVAKRSDLWGDSITRLLLHAEDT